MENQQSLDRHLLHVIKASAGSGKTHRLTGEYLRLLFSAPNNHRHILAVTFTNKATDEMKSRIVEELYRLASNQDSPYLADLVKDFSMPREDVRAKAKTVLETILHDYSSFSISTIDRFFQQTMRTFARETGLAGGYNIELDETSLLTETIDLMLSELDKPENKTLAEWLLRFMQHNIEEGKSWKIDRQVLDLAKQLFNETYKSFTDEERSAIQDKEQLEAYKQMLMRVAKSHENEVKSVGIKALSIMRQYGLSYDDFKHKRNSGFLLFTKLAGGNMEKPSTRLVALADNIDLWHSGNEKESAIRSAYSDGLNDCVKQIIYLSDNDREYQTAKHLLRNFYTLGILNDIKQRLRKLQQENNTLFLSDTTELLNDIIAGTDSPFIYEKTGTRVHHYMIDEFQDTSRMQWENFRPLIGESLASGNLNLIVGDVKQSIYRFRNSDWRLLEEQVKEDFQAGNIREHVLDTNWRSDAHIVQFNNAFFTKAAVNLQNDLNSSSENPRHTEGGGNNGHDSDTQITNAYADLYQQVPRQKEDSGGQVRITFLKDDKETDWKADVLERLPHEIESLQDQGFALKDIAIIVRWNHEAVQVAETLLSYREQHPQSPYRYDIISNEALLVRSAQSVKSIIALMRYFRNPKDEICRMMAIYEFYRFQRRSSPDEALQFYGEEGRGDFPEEIKGHLGELASMPFYEMTEHFFTLTADALDAKENAYVQAFLDIVLKFKESAGADLNGFLDWWDETGHRKALFSPEDQDAIRLITIHKSKGLGFGAVIMPFVSWGMDHNTHHNDIIWCKPGSAPFNTLGIAPLKYGKGLEDTIFRDSYLEEKRFTYIDNLNLLYVAFTRPRHRLIAFAPIPRKPETISDAADLLWRSITDPAPLPASALTGHNASPESVTPESTNPGHQRDYISLNEHFDEGETESVFEYGKPATARKPEEKAVVNSDKTGKWQSVPFGDRLQLRFNSIGYFSDDGSRDYGTMMHDIVSNVKTLADIPRAVEQKVSAGELAEDERDNTIRQLTEILSRPEISDWYSGKYTVLNETQVLHPDAGFSRPDRVMIGPDEVIVADYKFGETEDSKHVRQVRYYAQHIQEMGYENVSGYVFYVKQGKIVECPLSRCFPRKEPS
ncbi:exodeoxyribonuclease V subunit beta [Proteiniphilum sp. X52]|uniref:UvrD-helicase domain-containing protein n=1 Tax=Proteiniphilum sp. X52 TaxID=2382159 RepID=UPI000F0A1599|nr:UvrD-helicase domain-containing protein [Proteiniphilum sp. X52]RNC63338.1 ATP-dependent helicase [Proteiniphilum sp. X52]